MRALREQQGLTLSALAEAAGLSLAYLSRVENNRAALTLHNLALVAEALGVPMASFFESKDEYLPFVVCRAGEGKMQKVTGRPALTMELVAAAKRGKLMEPMIVEVHPERKSEGQRAHPGQEFNLVLSGTCQFTYGRETIALREGDSVYYDASVPHSVQATGGTCRLVAIVTSRDYLFHGDVSKLLQVTCR